jgi:hypothetical protein
MKLSVIIILLASLAFLSGHTVAAGVANKGYVDIYEVPASDRVYMVATMNVRHNALLSNFPYISISGSSDTLVANRPVNFFGRDSEGQYFSCYVLVDSPLYAAAVEISNNFKHGSGVTVYKRRVSNYCENFYSGQYSYYQN